MKSLGDMSWRERSLLTYFETRAVDYNGRVNGQHMNNKDMATAKKWHDAGFILYGRIKSADHNNDGGMWIELSDKAWKLAHKERRARHGRNPRHYKRIGED